MRSLADRDRVFAIVARFVEGDVAGHLQEFDLGDLVQRAVRKTPGGDWHAVLRQALNPRRLDENDAIGVDEVDGEFYWRCCRADLSDGWDLLRRGSSAGYPIVLPSIEAAAALAERTGLDAQAAFDHALTRRPIPMRFARIKVVDGSVDAWSGPIAPPVLCARVAAGSWTGASVERAIARWVRDHRPDLLPEFDHPERHTAIHLAFSLAAGDAATGVPATVLVEVGLPFPWPGTIERDYDAIVRAANQWHLTLVGKPTRQTPRVAVRTWAVGLLTAGGWSFDDAQKDVFEAFPGLVQPTDTASGLSYSGFERSRGLLIKRVPEAAPYVKQRILSQRR